MTIAVRLDPNSRVTPTHATMHVRWVDGERAAFTAEPDDQGAATLYRFDFSSVATGMEFHVTGHDARTEDYVVRVVDPPEIRRADFTLEYPGYQNRPAEVIENARGAITVPPGTWIEIRAAATKAVSSARLLLDGEPIGRVVLAPVEFAEAGETGLAGRFQAPGPDDSAGSARLEFELTDENRAHRGGGSFHLQYEYDQPPQVQVLWRLPGETISPIAMIPVEVLARDEFAVERLESMIQLLPLSDEPIAAPVEGFGPGRRAVSLANHTIDLQPLELTADDEMVAAARVWMRAADGLPAPQGPGVRDSEAREFEIVSEAELMAEQLHQQKQERLQMDQTITAAILAAELTEAAQAELAGEASAAKVRQLLAQSLGRQQEVSTLAGEIGVSYQSLLVRHVCNRLQETDQPEAAENARENMRLIVEQLDEVVGQDVRSLLSDLQSAAAESAAPEQVGQLARRQRAVVARLEAVREMMVRYEGLQELAVLLNRIIERASEVKDRLQQQRRQQADELFDP